MKLIIKFIYLQTLQFLSSNLIQEVFHKDCINLNFIASETLMKTLQHDKHGHFAQK